MQLIRFCFLLALLFSQSELIAASDSVTPPVAVLEPVVVQGPKHGPAMWRISKNGHDLWILGTIEALPNDLAWRSREVEERLASSKEILAPSRAELDWGLGDLFSAARMMPAIQKAMKNPEGRSLSEVIPPDVFLRWRTMRSKFGLSDDNGIESLRPMFASERIFREVINSAGDSSVVQQIAEMADRLHVKRVDTGVRFSISRADKAVMRRGVQLLADSRINDIQCFTQTIDGLDSSLEVAQSRVRAWAIGDLATLIGQQQRPLAHACKHISEPLTGFMRVSGLPAQLASAWMATAESALSRNDVTFATIPVDELTGGAGYLGRFRSRGYAVDTFHENSDLTSGVRTHD